jgi:hypothetical protein
MAALRQAGVPEMNITAGIMLIFGNFQVIPAKTLMSLINFKPC